MRYMGTHLGVGACLGHYDMWLDWEKGALCEFLSYISGIIPAIYELETWHEFYSIILLHLLGVPIHTYFQSRWCEWTHWLHSKNFVLCPSLGDHHSDTYVHKNIHHIHVNYWFLLGTKISLSIVRTCSCTLYDIISYVKKFVDPNQHQFPAKILLLHVYIVQHVQPIVQPYTFFKLGSLKESLSPHVFGSTNPTLLHIHTGRCIASAIICMLLL